MSILKSPGLPIVDSPSEPIKRIESIFITALSFSDFGNWMTFISHLSGMNKPPFNSVNRRPSFLKRDQWLQNKKDKYPSSHSLQHFAENWHVMLVWPSEIFPATCLFFSPSSRNWVNCSMSERSNRGVCHFYYLHRSCALCCQVCWEFVCIAKTVQKHVTKPLVLQQGSHRSSDFLGSSIFSSNRCVSWQSFQVLQIS